MFSSHKLFFQLTDEARTPVSAPSTHLPRLVGRCRCSLLCSWRALHVCFGTVCCASNLQPLGPLAGSQLPPGRVARSPNFDPAHESHSGWHSSSDDHLRKRLLTLSTSSGRRNVPLSTMWPLCAGKRPPLLVVRLLHWKKQLTALHHHALRSNLSWALRYSLQLAFLRYCLVADRPAWVLLVFSLFLCSPRAAVDWISFPLWILRCCKPLYRYHYFVDSLLFADQAALPTQAGPNELRMAKKYHSPSREESRLFDGEFEAYFWRSSRVGPFMAFLVMPEVFSDSFTRALYFILCYTLLFPMLFLILQVSFIRAFTYLKIVLFFVMNSTPWPYFLIWFFLVCILFLLLLFSKCIFGAGFLHYVYCVDWLLHGY